MEDRRALQRIRLTRHLTQVRPGWKLTGVIDDLVQDLLRFNDVEALTTVEADVLSSVTEEESSDTGEMSGMA